MTDFTLDVTVSSMLAVERSSGSDPYSKVRKLGDPVTWCLVFEPGLVLGRTPLTLITRSYLTILVCMTKPPSLPSADLLMVDCAIGN
jgi:hypothetical protein